MPTGVYKRTNPPWNKGKKGIMPPAWNKGLKGWNKGHLVSDETRKKIGLSRKGKPFNGKSFSWKGLKFSEGHKRKISLSMIGKKKSEKTRLRMSLGRKGIKFSKKHLENLSKSHIGKNLGEKNWNWRGGISKLNIYRHYRNREYLEWRKSVFARDGWTCLNCGVSGVFLHPHHIKSYTYYPEVRYDVENGVTLCVPCHHQLHFGH